jgi:branched-chain amino acid transport system permease protein
MAQIKTGIRRNWLLPAILGVVAIAIPPFLSGYIQHILILIMMWVTMATAWNLLGGYCGQVSFGHAVFFGLGAYGGGLLLLHWGISPWWGMVAGPLLAVIIGIPIGLICFRLRGPYFALAMLALGETFRIVFTNLVPVTNGACGIVASRTWGAEKLPYYYIALAIAALSVYVVYQLTKSKYGYYFVSIREDQDAAEALGIPTTRYKMYAIIPSAFFAGLAGAFYMNYIAYVNPDTVFNLSNISIMMILTVMVGGAGTLWGPVLGAAVFQGLNEGLRVGIGGLASVTVASPLAYLIFMIIACLIIMFLPDGIIGDWGKIKRIFTRRKPAYAEGE